MASKQQGDVLHTRDGALFVQTAWNTKPEYVGCVDVDSISEPGGGIDSLIRCFRVDGQGWDTISSTRTPPDPVTTTITEIVRKRQSVLESVRGCPISIYLHQRDCGYANQFGNYVRSAMLLNAYVGDRGRDNLVMMETDTQSTRTYAISAFPPAYDLFKLALSRPSIASATALNDVAFVDAVRCAGSCGPAQGICQKGFAVADPVAGSASNTANVFYTSDYGGTWTATATDPFAGAELIASVVTVPVSASVNRVIVARGTTDAGNPAEVAFSDDNGATWTAVDVGATNGQFAQGPNALYAVDYYNIWMVTDGGYIYYSDDGGQTWTAQEEGVATSEDLYAVHFIDSLVGYAAGANDAILKTQDGGGTWTVTSADPGTTDTMNTIQVLDVQRAWVGTSGGEIYYTDDAGDSWNLGDFSGSGAGAVKDMIFVTESIGWMIHNTAAPVGSVFRTINGGFSWEAWTAPTNTGLNALAACDENDAYAVGEVQGGTGVIVKVQPSQ